MQKPLVVANWWITIHESNQARIGCESPGYTLCVIRDLHQICLDSCIEYSQHKTACEPDSLIRNPFHYCSVTEKRNRLNGKSIKGIEPHNLCSERTNRKVCPNILETIWVVDRAPDWDIHMQYVLHKRKTANASLCRKYSVCSSDTGKVWTQSLEWTVFYKFKLKE